MKQDIRLPFPPPSSSSIVQNNLTFLILFFLGVIDHGGIAFAFHLLMGLISSHFNSLQQLIRYQR